MVLLMVIAGIAAYLRRQRRGRRAGDAVARAPADRPANRPANRPAAVVNPAFNAPSTGVYDLESPDTEPDHALNRQPGQHDQVCAGAPSQNHSDQVYAGAPLQNPAGVYDKPHPPTQPIYETTAATVVKAATGQDLYPVLAVDSDQSVIQEPKFVGRDRPTGTVLALPTEAPRATSNNDTDL